MKHFVIPIVCLTLLASTGQSEAKHRRHLRTFDGNGNVAYLAHPAGCPSRAFCGCGAAKHLGLSDRRLWLAANWPRYYRGSTPVAVWRGHVAVIDYWTGPNTAMLYDYNSGGHLSRHHVRDLRGARIIGGAMHATIGQPSYY